MRKETISLKNNLGYRYVGMFENPYRSLSVVEIYGHFSMLMMFKVHNITVFPFKKSEFVKYILETRGLSIPVSRLKNFYDFILPKRKFYKVLIYKGVRSVVFNNWRNIVDDLGLWFTNDMLQLKKVLEMNIRVHTLKFGEFHKWVLQGILIIVLRTEEKRVNRDRLKKERISSIVKRDGKGNISSILNHTNRNRYKTLKHFMKESKKVGLSLMDYLKQEERSLKEGVYFTASYLTKKLGLPESVLKQYLAKMDKDGLISRTAICDVVGTCETEQSRQLAMEFYGRYNMKYGQNLLRRLYTEMKLNPQLQPGQVLHSNSILVRSFEECKDIRKKSNNFKLAKGVRLITKL